jgi:hypothetical protein
MKLSSNVDGVHKFFEGRLVSSIRTRRRSTRWKHRRSGLAMWQCYVAWVLLVGPGVASASWMAILHDKVHITRAVNAAAATH